MSNSKGRRGAGQRGSSRRTSKSLPPILAARSVVRKTKGAEHLTPKEKEVVAKALVGEVSPNNPSIQDSPLVQETIIAALHDLGVDNQYLAQHIKDGLEADDIQIVSAMGTVTAREKVPAWATRHKYFETLRDMTGMKKPADGGTGPRSVHFHYKSNLGGEPEVIPVGPPKDSKAQRRLLAAKPTNRKGA